MQLIPFSVKLIKYFDANEPKLELDIIGWAIANPLVEFLGKFQSFLNISDLELLFQINYEKQTDSVANFLPQFLKHALVL